MPQQKPKGTFTWIGIPKKKNKKKKSPKNLIFKYILEIKIKKTK